MDSKNNPILISEQYFKLSNNRELDKVSNLILKDAIYSSDNTGLYYGRNDIMKMMTSFFNNFKTLNWKINDIKQLNENIVEIDFTLTGEDNNNNKIKKSGIERIVVVNNLIKHIEVRNN